MRKNSYFALAFLSVLIVGIIPLGFGQQPVSTSVAGGRGGSPFTDGEIPSDARVAEVHVYSGNVVDSVQMLYVLPNGRTTLGLRHGGPGGQQNIFRLDSDEYVVGLSGRYGEYIDSLQIQTNKRTSPVFGGRGGSRNYRIDVASGYQGVGFAGRAGEYLDAIGLTSIPLSMRISGQSAVAGGNGGSSFSDRNIPLGARISEIRVRAGNNIDSIQAVYILQDGRTFEGSIHGGGGGDLNVFALEPDEFITGLSGRYGLYIDSLTIQTNRRTSQTFGGRGGSRNFSITIPAGQQAVSLAGRSGEYLDAIGLNYSTAYRSSQRGRKDRFRIE